jgi:hypothetical protein
MATNNLRPDLKITQIFTPVAPIVPEAGLPVLLIGVNRHFEYQTATSLTDWNAGSISANVDFPNWLGGTVETSSATSAELRPHVYVTNEFGTAEITDVAYDFTGDPVFTVLAGADATFSIATGTTGVFAVNSDSPALGSFTDTNADFIRSQAAAGDLIYIGGVPTYRVDTAGIQSDTEVTVRRVDKGPGSIGASEVAKFYVTTEDSNEVRKLVTTSQSFIDAGGFVAQGVKVNDIVRLDNWSIKKALEGVTYTAVGDSAGELAVDNSTVVEADWRKLTFATKPSPFGVWDNSALSGTVVFVLNTAGAFVPEFFAASVRMGGGSLVFYAKDYASSTIAETAKRDDGVVYYQRNYTIVSSPGAYGLGAFTSATSNVRTFTDANLASIGGITTGKHVAIKDTDGIYRPVFNITSIADIASGQIEVTQFSDDIINPLYHATGVDYAILTVSGSTSYLGASVSVVATEQAPAPSIDGYQLTGDDRLLRVSPADTSDLDPGDLLFTDAGHLAFIVTAVPSPLSAHEGKLAVRLHPYAGITLADDETITNFGFTARTGGVRSDFKVRRLVNASELEIVELSTNLNPVAADTRIDGAIYFQTPTEVDGSTVVEDGDDPVLVIAPDSSAALNYEIKKTLTGANLTGDVLISYSEIRNDDLDLLEVTVSNREDLLGPAVPGNPMAMAASIALQNTPTAIYAMRVESDDSTGWTEAFDRVKVDTVYSIVPLTQEAAILAIAQAHVDSESTPANKHERILYQSAAFPRSVNRFTLSTETATVARGATQTVVIDADMLAEGVIVGDVVTATAFDGTDTISFESRITAISLDGQTLTTMPSADIPNPTTVPLAIVEMSIDSKTLSDAELRDEIADYATNLQNRRIRNIYPDNVTLAFTDETGPTTTTGVYGGGEVTGYDAGGFYLCAVEGAKRARFGPVKPLTKTGGPGIETIVDPFKGNSTYQDVIIDAGTYYMEQPSGSGANVQAIRALSTNSTDLVFVEDSVTTQIDYFARRLRRQLTPLLGPYILDEGFFTILSAQQGAVSKDILDNKQMKSIKLIGIEEDSVNPDTFRLSYVVEPYFSSARGEITIYI